MKISKSLQKLDDNQKQKLLGITDASFPAHPTLYLPLYLPHHHHGYTPLHRTSSSCSYPIGLFHPTNCNPNSQLILHKSTTKQTHFYKRKTWGRFHLTRICFLNLLEFLLRLPKKRRGFSPLIRMPLLNWLKHNNCRLRLRYTPKKQQLSVTLRSLHLPWQAYDKLDEFLRGMRGYAHQERCNRAATLRRTPSPMLKQIKMEDSGSG